MTSPSGTCSSVAWRSFSSLMKRDLHRGTRDLEALAIEAGEDRTVDAVLDLADAVLGHDEADGELDPVVGQRQEDARLERLALESVALFEPPAGTGRAFGEFLGSGAHGL